MEIFYAIAIFGFLIIQFFVLKKYDRMIEMQQLTDDLHKEHHILLRKMSQDLICLQQKVNNLSFKIDSYTSPVSASPTSPIKPNNWDSIREAFKGPVRVEVNERN